MSCRLCVQGCEVHEIHGGRGSYASSRRPPRLYVAVWGPERGDELLLAEALDLLRPLAVDVRFAETATELAGLLCEAPARAAQVLSLRRCFLSSPLARQEALLPCDVLGAATRRRVPDGEVLLPWPGDVGCFVAAAETARVLGAILLRNPAAILASESLFDAWMRFACAPRLIVADYDLRLRVPMDGALALVLEGGAPTCPLAWESFLSRAPSPLWSALCEGFEDDRGGFWASRRQESDGRLSLLEKALASNPRASHVLLAPSDSAPLWSFGAFVATLAWGQSYFDEDPRCCCLSRQHALELLDRGLASGWRGALRPSQRRGLSRRFPCPPRFLSSCSLSQLASEVFLVSGVRGDCPVDELRDAPLELFLAQVGWGG